MALAEKYDRCDVVADRYFKDSLKEGTRDKRGNDGSTLNFTGDSLFPSNFKDFLSNSANKNKLNELLAQILINVHDSSSSQLTLVVTYENKILTNNTSLLDQQDISDCSAEEADPRIIRHAINLARNGFEDITIRTVDSDVLVLSLANLHKLIENGSRNIFTQIVKSNGTEEFDLIELYNTHGADVCMALPFFHTYTGCHTSSSFFGKGKTSFWDAWMRYPKKDELTNIFIDLSFLPNEITNNNKKILEDFLIYVYHGSNHRFTDINDARIVSFFQSADPKLRETILSSDAHLEHTKRSAYQSGWLWAECVANINLPNPLLWGWKMNPQNTDKYLPLWESTSTSSRIEVVLTTCGCKTDSCKNCECGTLGEKCLTFCKCQRKCKNT